MKDLTVEVTVTFEVKEHDDPELLAVNLAQLVWLKLRNINDNVGSGVPAATRVFDSNGDYIAEF